jgi:hypothetical protein
MTPSPTPPGERGPTPEEIQERDLLNLYLWATVRHLAETSPVGERVKGDEMTRDRDAVPLEVYSLDIEPVSGLRTIFAEADPVNEEMLDQRRQPDRVSSVFLLALGQTIVLEGVDTGYFRTYELFADGRLSRTISHFTSAAEATSEDTEPDISNDERRLLLEELVALGSIH